MVNLVSLGDKSTYREAREDRIDVRRFRLTVVECPGNALLVGQTWESTTDKCAIGRDSVLNDFVIPEQRVSSRHCEIRIDGDGPMVHDLASANGTIVDGVRVTSAFLRGESTLYLGHVVLRFELLNGFNALPISKQTSFGNMAGLSAAMRSCFTLMEKAARSDCTVLFQGETGTGKTMAAEQIHRLSKRRDMPFVVVDCGSLDPQLIASELFGHKKGAFTGADSPREGAFKAADGGTVFLDEIGELPLDLQVKLLRALENREVKPLGSNEPVKFDVRIMAATHQDLRIAKNARRFREDLYYRLAVLSIRIPPLRERKDDLWQLVEGLLEKLGATEDQRKAIGMPNVPTDGKDRNAKPEFIKDLERSAWPGNIRELRNHIERCIALETCLPPEDSAPSAPEYGIDPGKPYGGERKRILASFEYEYLQKLMELHKGNVARAAEGADIKRGSLHRLLAKHGIDY